MLAPVLAIDGKPLKNQCFCGSFAVFESPLGHQKEKTRNPNGSRVFSLFFNASWSFRYFKILKRISIKRKQNQNFASKFACSFACCLLAIKKPLGSLRAALFISPMIFSLCPFRQQFRDTAFSARQTSQELRGALFRGILPFPFLRLCRRRNR